MPINGESHRITIDPVFFLQLVGMQPARGETTMMGIAALHPSYDGNDGVAAHRAAHSTGILHSDP